MHFLVQIQEFKKKLLYLNWVSKRHFSTPAEKTKI
nr:MAG TPA: hypothetical protein [Caudoviricetes sp.]